MKAILIVTSTLLPAITISCKKSDGGGETTVIENTTVENTTVEAPNVVEYDEVKDSEDPTATSAESATSSSSSSESENSVSGAAINSLTAPSAGTYGEGGTLEFQVHYDDEITVSGTPCFILGLDSSMEVICYEFGSGTKTLSFTYTIASGDSDADGISVNGDITGGSMIDSNGGQAASSLTALLPDLSEILIDTASGIVAPGQVSDLISSPTTSNTELSISWSVPANNGTDITHYSVQYRLSGDSTWINLSPNPSSAAAVIQGLSSGESYEVRVAANNGLQGDFSGVMSKTLSTVASDKFVLWYDASDTSTIFQDTACSVPSTAAGDAVNCWTDKSQSEINATGASGPTLELKGQNNLNTLSFNSQYLQNTFNLSASNYANLTVFTIHKADNENPGAIWGSDNGGWDRFLLDKGSVASFLADCVSHGSTCIRSTLPISETGAYKMVVITYQDGVSNGSGIHVDGTLAQNFTANQTGTAGTMEIGSIGNGGDPQFRYTGDIAELLMYDGALTDIERQELEGYLACKWNLQSSLPADHSYKTACP